MKFISAIILVLFLAGCGDQGSQSADYAAAPERGSPPTGAAPGEVPGAEAPVSPPATGKEAAGDPTPVATRQIIRSGQLSLVVESLDSAERAFSSMVAANGGYTANASRSRISGTALAGTIEARVPTNRFDALLDGVRRLGSVESENINAQDVTQEYIDLEARLKGQQQLEERLLKLLAERPGKLADIVAIEEKLAAVRSTIESLQGQLRFLRNRLDYSTLAVTFTERGAIGTSERETFGGRIGRAFNEGMDGLVGLTAGLVTIAMVLVPLVLLVLVAWWAYRAWRRKHPAKPSAPQQRPPAQPVSPPTPPPTM